MIPNQLPIFISVVRSGSFSATARELGISAAAVSKSISQLEKKLQIRVFHRSTHSLTLTEEGRSLHQRTAHLVEELEDQIKISADTRESLHGLIKINLPIGFGHIVIYPLLLEFMQEHPGIELDLHFDDRAIDLVENGFDIGIGNKINEESRLIARRIYSLNTMTVCSPSYLAKYGEPQTIADLNKHNCIAHRSPTSGTVIPWRYNVNGEEVQHIPQGNTLTVNNPVMAYEAAKHSVGIARASQFQTQADVDDGTMVEILKGFKISQPPVWLYYSSRKYIPARVRLLIDFLIHRV